MQVSVDASESLDRVAGASSLGLDSVTVRPAAFTVKAFRAARAAAEKLAPSTGRAALPEDALERQRTKPRDSHSTASATSGGYSVADPCTEKRPAR